jgi:hypothetical protein
MSNITFNPEACATSNENLGQNSCIAQKMLALSAYFSPGKGKKYEIEDLQSESFVQGEIAAGRLYKLPTFQSAISLEQSDVQTTTNNYGNIITTSTKAAFNATMGIDGGTCTFRKLKQWNNREVTLWFVDNNRFAGTLSESGGDLFLGGISGKLTVRDGIKFKAEDTDENIYAIELNIQSPNAEIDEFASVNYNPAEKFGITDSVISVVSTDTNEIVVGVYTGCDGLPVSGLVGGDFVVLNSGGTPVVVTATEGASGVYTLAGTLPAGTYSVALDGSVDIGGFLYATFGTPSSAVIGS